MAEAHLDHPGDFHFFSGYGPARVKGPCPHTGCPHHGVSVIAWGPDYEHYELLVCEVNEGCAGRCRGWKAEFPYPESLARGAQHLFPDQQRSGWVEVEDA